MIILFLLDPYKMVSYKKSNEFNRKQYIIILYGTVNIIITISNKMFFTICFE